MRKLMLLLCTLLATAQPGLSATVELLTFDDLPTMPNGVATEGLNGYGNLGWSNFLYNAGHVGVGYLNNMVSSPNDVFNPSGNPGSILAEHGTFSLVSGYFGAAWRDGMQITVDGYLHGNLIDTQQFTVQTSGPVFETFNFSGIDDAVFTTAGGTLHPGYNLQDTNGEQLVMDNLTVITPEPASLALAALGSLGLTLAALRHRHR